MPLTMAVKELRPRPPCASVPHTFEEAPGLMGRGQSTMRGVSGGLVADERTRTPLGEEDAAAVVVRPGYWGLRANCGDGWPISSRPIEFPAASGLSRRSRVPLLARCSAGS